MIDDSTLLDRRDAMKTEMMNALVAATKYRRVPFFGQLTAGLVMAGFRIVPRDLWDDLARKFDYDDYDSLPVGSVVLSDIEDGEEWNGFVVRSNHSRSEQHEYWQNTILPEGDGEKWVIPVDEFECLAKGDEGWSDFVSITRLVFVGSESELRAAVAALPNSTS